MKKDIKKSNHSQYKKISKKKSSGFEPILDNVAGIDLCKRSNEKMD